MVYDNNNLFESVIHITKERDTRSLGKNLLKTLADFISFDTLVLFHVPRNSSDEYMEVAECLPNNIFQDKQISASYDLCKLGIKQDNSVVRCIKNAETVITTVNGIQRILIPIIVNNNVTDILDIHGHKLTSNTKNIIHGFISIFSNFLTVIDDNEHDTLTGLLNRKTFDLRLSELIAIADENNSIITNSEEERRTEKDQTYHWAGILDIDYFKSINDKFGHVFGDEILLLFSNLMEKSFRSNDLLFRYGGEEFVVVLTPTTEASALKVYERFLKTLEEFDFPQVGRVTASIGMVKIADQEHATTVLEHADQALYYAKEHGRNQVCHYHSLIKNGDIKELHVESEIEFF